MSKKRPKPGHPYRHPKPGTDPDGLPVTRKSPTYMVTSEKGSLVLRFSMDHTKK